MHMDIDTQTIKWKIMNMQTQNAPLRCLPHVATIKFICQEPMR